MADFTKSLPAGSTQINQGDDVQRVNNDALEERLGKEHYFPDNPLTNRSGRHMFGYGAAAARDAAITAPAVGNIWGDSALAMIWEHSGSAWVGMKGYGTGTAAARPAAGAATEGWIYYATDTGEVSINISAAWLTLLYRNSGIRGLFQGRIQWTSVSQVTIARGYQQLIAIELDGIVVTSASDIVIDISTADREDTSGSGGSASEQASVWYYLYLHNNAGVLTEHISFTAPVMDPAVGKVGYHPGTGTGAVTWRCIGAVFNNSTSDILAFDRGGDGWTQLRLQSSQLQVSAGLAIAQGTYALIDLTTAPRKVPATARTVRILARIVADDYETFYGHESLSTLAVATNKSPHGMNSGDAGGNDQIGEAQFDIPIDATPNLAWGNADNGFIANSISAHVVSFIGWKDDLGLIHA